MQMTIGEKLILGFLGIALMVGIVGYIGVSGITKINKYADLEDAKRDAYNEIAKLEAIMLDQVHEAMHLLSFGEESCIEVTKKLGEDFRKQLEEIEITAPELKEKFQTIKVAHGKFEEMFDKTVKAHYAGQLTTSEQRREMHEKWCPVSDEVIELARGLQPLYVEKAKEACKVVDQVTITTRRNIMLTSIVVILLALGIGFLITRTISIPLRALTITTTTLATKAADLTQVIEVKTKDEIGQLGEAYNKLIESLRGIIKQIRDSGLQLTTVTNQILTASQQQATGIEEEATQISQTAASARQLATTAKQVTDRGNEIEKSSANSLKMIKSRNETCAKCRNARENIREAMLETAKKIEGLGERAQSITEIVSIIENIADQTNLLSLNASIEAARAGEAGKGFAVVADAIGKLAEKTTKSTKDISDLIKGVQQETSGAVLSAEKSTKAIEETTPIAEEAANAMLEVGKAFEQVAQSAKEIALSSQQQSSGSEQISKAMMGIDQIMRQSATSAKQSTASARDLAKLAEELKKAVGQFKLGEEKNGEEV